LARRFVPAFPANIPIAAITTFVSLPPTVLFVFLPAAAEIGIDSAIAADRDGDGLYRAWRDACRMARVGESDAAPAIGLGLILLRWQLPCSVM
jgi:hypothetical protein